MSDALDDARDALPDDPGRARELVEAALPADDDERAAETHRVRGRALAAAGDHEAAVEAYDAALDVRESHDAYVDRGNARARLGDTEGAIDDYTAALAVEESARAYHNRASAYVARGDFESVVEDYTAALALDPDAETHYKRGTAYARAGRTAEAIEDYDAAIERDPDHAAALNARGMARADRGDLDAAVEDYTRAIAADPDHAEAHFNRALAHARRGDVEASDEDVEAAIEASERFADAYLKRGNAYARQGDLQRALADFDRAVERTDAARAYFNRGNAKRELDRDPTDDYRRALERAPELPDEGLRVHRTLATVTDGAGRARHLFAAAALAVCHANFWEGVDAAADAVDVEDAPEAVRRDAAALVSFAASVGESAGGFGLHGREATVERSRDLLAAADDPPPETRTLAAAARGEADEAAVRELVERARSLAVEEVVAERDRDRLRVAAFGRALDQQSPYSARIE